jgi:hypothetical protein
MAFKVIGKPRAGNEKSVCLHAASSGRVRHWLNVLLGLAQAMHIAQEPSEINHCNTSSSEAEEK